MEKHIPYDFNLAVDVEQRRSAARKGGYLQEKSLLSVFGVIPERDRDEVVKVNIVPRNANQCRVMSDGRSVFTNARVYGRDVLEVCPAKRVDKTSLYSKDMRDMVFEVVPNEVYVVPFGYCQYYEMADEAHPANCDFEWDPATNSVVISALKKMPRYERLYLNTVK